MVGTKYDRNIGNLRLLIAIERDLFMRVHMYANRYCPNKGQISNSLGRLQTKLLRCYPKIFNYQSTCIKICMYVYTFVHS